MAFAGSVSHDFTGTGYLEPLGYCFTCFGWACASHKICLCLKKSANYMDEVEGLQVVISGLFSLSLT